MSSETLSDWIRELARTYGERTAAVGESGRLAFIDLDRAADAWSERLKEVGIGPASHVGLLFGNGPTWLAIAAGVWRAGATLVPISTFVTARELGEILSHADVDVLVAAPRLRSHDYRAMLGELPAEMSPREVIFVGAEDSAGADEKWDDVAGTAGPTLRPAQPALRSAGTAGPTLSAPPALRSAGTAGPTLSAPPALSSAARGPSPQSPAPRFPAPDSAACILYTSGTTGRPKGVMLSHRAILATVAATAERTGLGPDDSLLSTLPLFWVAGLVIRALPTLATGCALILPQTFTADAVVEALRRHRPTALHLRPPQVGEILAHDDFTPELFGRVHRGGGRAEWFGDALRHDARLITGYGMTEMAGYVCALRWDDPEAERRDGMGALLPNVEVRIVGGDGEPLATGEVGEIRVRGPGLFSGYYKEPRDAGLDDAGRFVTGDLGYVDAGGGLHFVGRSKDLLRIKGINVSPLEVEAILGRHADVEAVYIIGLPPDGLDQRLIALIVAAAHAESIEAELRALAQRELSHYKRPDTYLFIDRSEVVLGSTAKPQRAALAALAASRMGGASGGGAGAQ